MLVHVRKVFFSELHPGEFKSQVHILSYKEVSSQVSCFKKMYFITFDIFIILSIDNHELHRPLLSYSSWSKYGIYYNINRWVKEKLFTYTW